MADLCPDPTLPLPGEEDTQPYLPLPKELRPSTEVFADHFDEHGIRALGPLDGVVNYAFGVGEVDPWTLEVWAGKYWIDPTGRITMDWQTLRSFPLSEGEAEDAAQRELAAIDRENLEWAFEDGGLEAAMRHAEGLAVIHGELDPNRPDGRLFREGPTDRFTTLREAEFNGEDVPFRGVLVLDITEEDTQPIPAVEPGSWEELVAREAAGGAEPAPEPHYWQMHTRTVVTPAGEPLGVALFLTEFPQLPADFDATLGEFGMDDSLYPTEARTLEMAHFAREADARKFQTEFRSYLVPGLLDGPELAPEVAKLEGLSGEWEAMDYRAIVDYMSSNRTIVREADDWHLHDPNAEQAVQYNLDVLDHEIDF